MPAAAGSRPRRTRLHDRAQLSGFLFARPLRRPLRSPRRGPAPFHSPPGELKIGFEHSANGRLRAFWWKRAVSGGAPPPSSPARVASFVDRSTFGSASPVARDPMLGYILVRAEESANWQAT